MPHSFLAKWRSEWQIPQYNILNRTSLSPVALLIIVNKNNQRSDHIEYNSHLTKSMWQKNKKKSDLRENVRGESMPEVSRAAYP